MQLHKLALTFQKGSEGRYIYGQNTSVLHEELAKGDELTMR